MSEHKAAEKAAKDFFASNKNETDADIMEDFMWADNLEINAEACNIDNPDECLTCGS